MDRANVPYSRLLAGAVVMAMGLLAGCERQDVAYDPQVDGILVRNATPPDLTILDDQKLRHPFVPVRTSSPQPTSLPATTESTPPPPLDEAAPPPPPDATAPAAPQPETAPAAPAATAPEAG